MLFISAIPTFLNVQEIIISLYMDSKYKVVNLINTKNYHTLPKNKTQSEMVFGRNKISIIVNDTERPGPESRIDYAEPKNVMEVKIVINGKEILPTYEALLSPTKKTDSRFLSWLNIIKLPKQDEIVIIQKLTPNYQKGIDIRTQTMNQAWRILYIDDNGQITEENFTYPERRSHLLGIKLINLSSMANSFLGYKSDITSYDGTFLFPLFYPYLIFIFGLVFTVNYIRRLINNNVVND
ncbi:MAG: hypothetical protein P0Y55_06870 [Candidatus Cohnella colombiensis]|uniref:ResB-like domain-containing protein n=1 Tax=Candidatus Cohnella colombiensis TaxID=3121368 RepID=A0AA95JCZ6_9BACL|nr:MAG: hypothetical protein P0Y55_06870 [Cohnella sp.]